MNKQQIDQEIKKFEPTIEKDSDEFWAYRVFISLAQTGPFKTTDEVTEKVCKFWGTRKALVKTMCHRAWTNKVVRVGKKHQEQFLDGELYNDGLGFALGANIMLGRIKRVEK